MITNKQNHNVINYDYIVSNHDCKSSLHLSWNILRNKTICI